MEHIPVNFPVSRTVVIDGDESGRTNTVLRIEEGRHTGGDLPRVRFYPVVIGFDASEDKKELEFFKNLPTTFKLSAGSIDRLRAVNATLLNESPDHQKLLRDLK